MKTVTKHLRLWQSNLHHGSTTCRSGRKRWQQYWCFKEQLFF